MSENGPPPGTDEEWLSRARRFAAELGVPSDHEHFIIRALTHRSLSETASFGDNERLEFLGDSVLALLVNDHLFRTFPEHSEGQLTKMKARYVSGASLAKAALALDLGSLLAMAAGDEAAGGRERTSTLSDTFEAVLAAVYLSQGLDAARRLVTREVIERVDPTEVWDYKSLLQELLQEQRRLTPVYHTAVEGGPAHERVFRSQVFAGEHRLGAGTGRSKKLAEQAAAEEALLRLDHVPDEPAPVNLPADAEPSGSPGE